MKQIAYKIAFTLLALVGFTQCGNSQQSNQTKMDNKNATQHAAEAKAQTTLGTTYVLIETPKGNMTAVLYDETPQHRDNFIKLIEAGFYNDLLFHRVIKGFMIQGGDPDSKNAAANVSLGSGGPGYTIPAELKSGKGHKLGALAAARLGDQMNPTKASSGSQFYIVQGRTYTLEELQMVENRYGRKFTADELQTYTTIGGTPFLDNEYTVFGEVIEGLEVIDAIANVATNRGDRPVEDVTMKISIVKK